MPGIAIRLMREEDWARVIEILGHWGMAPVAPTPECPEPEITALEVGRTLVAVADGRVVGVASYRIVEPGFAYTESLSVDPRWVGTGVADRLQRARLETLLGLGVVRLRAQCDRARTIGWYLKRYGYRIVGSEPKRHPFGNPDCTDWVLLELDLAGWAHGRRRARALPSAGGPRGD